MSGHTATPAADKPEKEEKLPCMIYPPKIKCKPKTPVVVS
jgi:hypothetical protein